MSVDGLGLGWRPALAQRIAHDRRVRWVEIVAESPLERSERELLRRDFGDGSLVVHGIGLSLGGAERPDAGRLRHLARLAEDLRAPLISEHAAFVRADGLEAGHLVSLPRTEAALRVLCANVREAAAELPVPLALENLAHSLQWPRADYEEADFLGELADRTGCGLLLDVSNLWANGHNHGWNLERFVERFDWSALRYLHIAGGVEADGFYRDTHAHSVGPGPRQLLDEVLRRAGPMPVLLERDDHFPSPAEWDRELGLLSAAVARPTVEPVP